MPAPILKTSAPSRRTVLRSLIALPAAAAALGGTVALAGRTVRAQQSLKTINLAWNPNSVCLSPVASALERGIFTRHGLKVEVTNYAGSTEQLLEAIATGKSDAGIGMALRWLKPLEQGFDVKLVAGTHGGCMRLLGSKSGTPVTSFSDLRGKTVAVADLGSPAKNFFSILLLKNGVDPEKEVTWKVFPPDLLGLSVDKGEAQAIAHWDPDTFRFLRDNPTLVEIATNLTGEYQNRVCCVVGVRGSLLREDRSAAGALTQALLEAQDFAVSHPEEVAKDYAKYTAKVTEAELVSMLKSQTHHHHPLGNDLKTEIALYTDDLKKVNVIRASTDPKAFAEKIYADVLV